MSSKNTNLIPTSRSSVSEPLKRLILALYNHECHYCGVTLHGGNIQIDHAIPLSKGGCTLLENLRASCPMCHHQKANRTETEYFSWKKTKQTQSTLTQSLLSRLSWIQSSLRK